MSTITKPQLSDMMQLLLESEVHEAHIENEFFKGNYICTRPDPGSELAMALSSNHSSGGKYTINARDLVEGAWSDNPELKYVYSILLERAAVRAGYPGQVGKLITKWGVKASLADRVGKVLKVYKKVYTFKFRTDYTSQGVVYRTWFSKTKERNFQVLRHTVFADPSRPDKRTDVTYSSSEYS